MENNMIMVESQSDMTLVINVPDIPFQKIWKKRGAKYPCDRRIMEQAFYDQSVEYLFKEGLLTTDDKEFLENVGLLADDGKSSTVASLTENLMNRMIKLMPMAELKQEISKLSQTQIQELVDYAIANYTDLKNDRIDLFSKISHKDVLTAITNYKKSQED